MLGLGLVTLSFFVIFSIGPHNLEFLAKNPLSFSPKAKNMSFFGLEFFAKCTKNKPALIQSNFGYYYGGVKGE